MTAPFQVWHLRRARGGYESQLCARTGDAVVAQTAAEGQIEPTLGSYVFIEFEGRTVWDSMKGWWCDPGAAHAVRRLVRRS